MPPERQDLSQLFAALAARIGEGKDVRLGDVLSQTGSRAHGIAILLLSLPEALPLPLPSFGAVLGIPLILVSAHLFIYGAQGHLPARVLDWHVPSRVLDALSRVGGPVLRRAEGLSRSRFQVLATRERLIGLCALVLSLLLFLPIPLFNVPLAIVLVLLAWGLIQRDGLFVALGAISTLMLVTGIMILGDAGVEMLRGLLAR